MRRELDPGEFLLHPDEVDPDDLFGVVDRERERLGQWLPWVDGTQCSDHTRDFLQAAAEQERLGNGPTRILLVDGSLAGVAAFHVIDWPARSVSVGYWLAQWAVGRGVVSRAVRALLAHAFEDLDLEVVRLYAALENARSRAVAERTGFVQESIAPGHERIRGRVLDAAVYRFDRADWAPAGVGET